MKTNNDKARIGRFGLAKLAALESVRGARAFDKSRPVPNGRHTQKALYRLAKTRGTV